MTVDVEHAHRVGMGARMVGAQGDSQLGRAGGPGELAQAPAHRLGLGRPVEAEQAPEGDGVDAGEALDARLADEGGKDYRQHERADPVEGGRAVP